MRTANSLGQSAFRFNLEPLFRPDCSGPAQNWNNTVSQSFRTPPSYHGSKRSAMFETIVEAQSRIARQRSAIIEGSQIFTYGQMASDIPHCAQWLKREGFGAGDRVVIHQLSGYRHWLVFFALEAIGAVSVASPWPGLNDQGALSFLNATRFVTSVPQAASVGLPGAVLDRGWLVRLRKIRLAPLPARKRKADDPVCIVVSSGTTGLPKKVLFTREMLDRRIFTQETKDLVDASFRILVELPIASIGGLTMALNTLAVGATLCVSTLEMSWEDRLTRFEPALIAGAPAHYGQIMAALPIDYVPRNPIHAAVGGGSLPPALARQVRSRLRGGVTMIYGSTEMGYVTRGDDLAEDDDRTVGRAWPWAEVVIRRTDGTHAAPDEIGDVWVRGPHVVDRYLEDDRPLDSGFSDGWFHPGDLGSLTPDATLLIHGRTDDVINYRGRKMLPSTVENAIRRSALTEDVAVFMATHPEAGEALVWIVCVAREGFDISALAPVMPRGVGFALSFIDAIPRNAMGKIERAALRARAERGDLPGRWLTPENQSIA